MSSRQATSYSVRSLLIVTPPPPTLCSIRVRKNMPYRGAVVEFSNRYFLGGVTSMTDAERVALADAVVAGEKAIYPGPISIDDVIAYDPGSEVPVWSKTYAVSGTLSSAGSNGCPGDAAMLVRYSTTQRTSKNHPIYLFNYYHGVRWENTLSADYVGLTQLAALSNYASNWVAGGWVAGKSYKKAGPYGAVAQGAFAEPLITHRDFPR